MNTITPEGIQGSRLANINGQGHEKEEPRGVVEIVNFNTRERRPSTPNEEDRLAQEQAAKFLKEVITAQQAAGEYERTSRLSLVPPLSESAAQPDALILPFPQRNPQSLMDRARAAFGSLGEKVGTLSANLRGEPARDPKAHLTNKVHRMAVIQGNKS